MVRNKPEIASEFGKIPIYGRDKNVMENEARFQKIRTFYKWWSAMNKNDRNKKVSTESDSVCTPSEHKNNGRVSLESIFSKPKIQTSVNIEKVLEEQDSEIFNAV
jgi:hypothetical protein